MKLSLVVPCYNEMDNVQEFYHCAKACFRGKIDDYEIIFVNDGSTDKTLEKLYTLTEHEEPALQIVSFSRNFGKESAIYAGLAHSRGDTVCIIDADLQQRPEVVLEMMKILDSRPEVDCVCAYQEKRRENKLISFVKSLFYKIINGISDVDFVNGASDFRLMKRQMVNVILSMTEYHRFSKGIFSWIGFNTEYIPYEVASRKHGKTKWSPKKLFDYGVGGIIAFSTAPLKFVTVVGFVSAFLSIAYMITVIVQKLCFGIDVPGYATIIVLLLLMGGLILFCLGIIGEYLAKMYVQLKNRPIYIEKEHFDNRNK
ncbi:MAG: glycosyltransferase family 2 protein [Clostridia bacterium]|nr:glycosyltransferase family 2 protein [Clostridia bacterium]